jgi:hypothetical protein
MGRVTEKTVRIGNFTVPPGVVVGTPLYAIHNTQHNWEDPHTFRPERWLDVPVETYVYNAKSAAPGTTAAAEGEARTNKLAAAAAASKEGITFMPFRWARGGLRVALTGCAWELLAQTGLRRPPRKAARSPMSRAPDPGCAPAPPSLPRPCSDGPRSCVGQSLAKAEVMTLLAKILGNFTIGEWPL